VRQAHRTYKVEIKKYKDKEEDSEVNTQEKMKKKIGRILFPWFLFCFCYLGTEGSTVIMPLDQIKAGMKGKGKSVFEESKIEEFDVEILGVMSNIDLPKRSVILAKLSGKSVDNAGVISGMSGSPVYIDGKLIGAIAFNFPFSKEAITGITPIADMLAISGEKEKPAPSFTLPVPFKKSLTLEEFFEINKDFFSTQAGFFSEGQTFLPLRVPLFFSGFSSQAFEKAKPFFAKMGLFPVKGGSSSQSLETISPPDLTLGEGDPVGAQLIGGDLSLVALGTVTYVDGNKILAFGHPLYNLGTVDYAMTKAKVITVVPSLEISFKLAMADVLVGKFSQDRSCGAYGEIGKMPQLIPLNVKILGPKKEIKDFTIKIVHDKILSPLLANVALSNILISEERSVGDLSLELEGDIYLDNSMSVHLEDLFSGNLDSSTTNLSGLLLAVVYFLTNNEFKELGIHRMDLTIQASEQAKFCFLERVWLDKYEVSPGERIQTKIYYRTFGGERIEQEVPILAPNLPTGSEFQLIIADAASMHQIETSQYRSQIFVPRNLSQLIRMLNNLRKNNRIYFKIVASKPGLFLRGEEMPNLPPTMKFMFSSPRAAASSPTELTRSTLNEYQLPVPYVFKGVASIPIKIRK